MGSVKLVLTPNQALELSYKLEDAALDHMANRPMVEKANLQFIKDKLSLDIELKD